MDAGRRRFAPLKKIHAMSDSTKETILVVDDNTINQKTIMNILQGEYSVFPAISGERAMLFLDRKIPDLILLDIMMPDMDGYQVMEKLKANPQWESIPVIFLTSVETHSSEEHALSMGAVDYITKPVVPGVLTRRVALHMELEAYRKSLQLLVIKKTEQLTRTHDAILDILANVTVFRDNETGAHILRTTEYVRILVEAIEQANAPEYKLDSRYARDIIKSAKLHDIGKVAIADSILLKPDRLSPGEFDRIKAHTTCGAMMIDNAIHDLGEESAFLSTAQELIYTHHECWDGSGYPRGLRGTQIPLSGRIMAIADVYDALISRRPYKSAFTHENAMFIIHDEAGTHFDEGLLELCSHCFPQFADIAQSISDAPRDSDLRAW